MRVIHHFGHVVGGTLLIAGTTIGVGMLGLPIATAPGGFVPSLVTFLICWLFMLSTGLLLLEVCSWMPKDANLISMTYKFLGPVGRVVCWVFYLFFFFALMVAHVAGGGDILNEITKGLLPDWVGIIVYVILFAPVVYLGTHSVDRLNLFLMAGLGITYFLLVGIALPHINPDLLKHMNWAFSWCATPILFTAFAYQFIIPTLVTYMERDFKKIRFAVIVGSSIPCFIYLLWEFTILGIVPVHGAEGLVIAGQLGDTAIAPLRYVLLNPYLFEIGKYFAFFTMTVSFIALAISFLDFLSDGLHTRKKGFRKVLLLLVIFIPPMVVAFTYPEVFSVALKYAGGLSVAVLFGLFPPLMVWIGRYVKKCHKMPEALFGGKPLLILLLLLTVVELFLDFFLPCAVP